MARRILCFALCLALVFSLGVTAAAAEGSDLTALTVEAGEYELGFSMDNMLYGSGSTGPSITTTADWSPEQPSRLWAFDISAATGGEIAQDGPEITVGRVTLTQCEGTPGVFSLAEDSALSEVENAASVPVYLRETGYGSAYLSAELSVTLGGETYSGTARVGFSVREKAPTALRFYAGSALTGQIAEDSTVGWRQLDGGTVYLTKEGGFSDEELRELEIWVDGEIFNNYTVDGDRITLSLPAPDDIYYVNVNCGTDFSGFSVSRLVPCVSFDLPGREGYTAGIVDETGRMALSGSTSTQFTAGEWSEGSPRELIRSFTAEVWKDGSEAGDADITFNRFRLEQLGGESGVFSLEREETVLKKTPAPGESIALYAAKGGTGIAVVYADVTVTMGGESYDTTLVWSAGFEPMPDSALKFYADSALTERLEQGVDYSYYQLPERAVYLTGFSDAAGLEIRSGGQEAGYTLMEDGRSVRIELSDPGYNGRYMLAAYSGMDSASLIIVARPQASTVAVEHGGRTYVAGFILDFNGAILIDENPSAMNGGSTDIDPQPDADWESRDTMEAGIGVRCYDEEGGVYYELDKSSAVKLKVNRYYIETYYGKCEGFEQTFSFAPDRLVTSVENPGSGGVTLYVKPGYDAVAMVYADVTITAGGESWDATVGFGQQIGRVERVSVTRPEGDTVEALNAYLAEIAQSIDEETRYDITLAPGRYEGTIVLPKDFGVSGGMFGEINLIGSSSRTVLESVDLNGGVLFLQGVDFVSGGQESALYNGFAHAQRCSFTGYEIALDATASTIAASFCVFAGNGTAFRLKLEQGFMSSSSSSWAYNTFIDNGTAMQFISFNDIVTPYFFRIRESNFIDNDTDFDLQCPATLYFHSNYFGQRGSRASEDTAAFYAEFYSAMNGGGNLNNLVKKTTPSVRYADRSESKVVTNPRWHNPCELVGVSFSTLPGGGSASSGDGAAAFAAGENYLTIDWDFPTDIPEEDAVELMISAEAFAEATEADRVINIVDENGNVVASWNFGAEAHELEGGFNAAVTVTKSADGKTSVAVQASDEILSALLPTLTVPGARGGVRHDGEGVASDSADGSVSFVAGSSGEYEIGEDIEETKPEEPEEPETPVTPGTPVAPEEPEEPEEPALSFDDVQSGSWFYEYVAYVVENGLMEGLSGTEFAPGGGMTRAMFWAVLGRMDGETITGAQWIETAREWATASGVSDGSSAGELITREQMAAMLYRFAGSPAAGGSLEDYADAGSVSAWAREAMLWAVENGVINGMDGTLSPGGTATRAQAAAMLTRFAGLSPA